MANQTVKGIQILFFKYFESFCLSSSGCYTYCEVKMSQAQHSFQKPLFCRYGEKKNSEIVPKKYLAVS